MDKITEKQLFGTHINWKALGECSQHLLEKTDALGTPKRVFVDLRQPSEFGENVSNKEIFKMVDREYSKNDVKVIDVCLTYIKKGYIIIAGLKI